MTGPRSMSRLLLLVLFLAGGPGPGLAADESDPLQTMNRATHWFNDRLDVFLLEPVARGWRFITPDVARYRLGLFFTNLRMPMRFVGSLFQLKLRASAEELERFVVNTTAGLGGLFDPASGLGIGFHDEDFGQALGYWGVPAGPYLVLPLFGPSNPRDAVGLAVDTLTLVGPSAVSSEAGLIISGGHLINARAQAIDELREAKEAALDYYVLRRNGYIQRREAKIRDGEVEREAVTDDFYEIEEFDDE